MTRFVILHEFHSRRIEPVPVLSGSHACVKRPSHENEPTTSESDGNSNKQMRDRSIGPRDARLTDGIPAVVCSFLPSGSFVHIVGLVFLHLFRLGGGIFCKTMMMSARLSYDIRIRTFICTPSRTHAHNHRPTDQPSDGYRATRRVCN